MTDDRIEGAARVGVGRLQDAAGGLLGDDKTQAKGKLNQAGGAIQDAYGKAREQVETAFGSVGGQAQDAVDDLADTVREHPLAAVGISIGVGFLLGLLATSSRR